jgi:tetratricopeptide (TPR) repeat protein
MPPHVPARFPADDITAPALPTGSALPPDVLAELPEEAAFTVWQVLRCVVLWTGEPEPRRATMFNRPYMREWEQRLLTAELDTDARFPLAVIVGELARATPDAGRLSWACVCVADWALGRGAHRAALAFAEAAARAAPDHPRYAWVAGRLMRSHGDPRAAERWLRRALRLAIAQRDWETQARTLISLGNLFIDIGKMPAARDFHARALRISRRWRLREQEGMALHDLFVIATEEGNRAEAEALARDALAAYGDADARICKLAHDVAYAWMLQGNFHRALHVFEALRPQFPWPDEQLRIVANMARAAAGIGDEARFHRMREEAEGLRPRLVSHETHASALLEIAHGAASLGDVEIALAAAHAAREVAVERREANVRVRAEALLETLAGARPTGTERMSPVAGASTERLAEELTLALTRALAVASAQESGGGAASLASEYGAGADLLAPPPGKRRGGARRAAKGG